MGGSLKVLAYVRGWLNPSKGICVNPLNAIDFNWAVFTEISLFRVLMIVL